MARDICFLKADTLEIVWQTQPVFTPELVKKWGIDWRKVDLDSYAVAQNYTEISPDLRPYPPGCVYVGARLFEDVDGRIWGLASSDWGDRQTHEITGTSAGVFSFDVGAHKHAFHPIEFSTWGAPELMSPSPDGLKAVRTSPNWELGQAFDAGHDRDKFVWMIDRKYLDVWSVAGQKPVNRLHISDMPSRAYIGSQYAKPEAHLRKLARWSGRAKDAFRMPRGKPPGTKKLNTQYDALRDLRDLRKSQRLSVHWEKDSQALWIETNMSLSRISADGKRGPLLIFDRFLNDEYRSILGKRAPGTDIGIGETYPSARMPLIKTLTTTETDVEICLSDILIRFPQSLSIADAPMLLLTDDMISVSHLPKLSAKDIAAKVPGLIKIKSWREVNVASGLRVLAQTLRHDIKSLMANGLSLVFQVRSSFMDEKQFFQKLSEKDVDVGTEAKEVIDGWCAAIRAQNLMLAGNEEGAGPLCYVLEYLADRDDTCAEQLRNYCILRDGEHESYSRDTVLRSYLDRLGYTHPDLWRLGILYCLLFGRDGRSMVVDGQQVSDWVHTGLLSSARENLQPQDFARFVRMELAEFEKQPDKFAAFGTHAEAASSALQDLLSQLTETPWNLAVKADLLA
ncbi:MAG: hypothetical protein ACRBB0_14865 [Pelagimonas sp.]|uniref:hypothetical protein n=1 Tax=Pelagimonas sp. TaxID=2073170 RepID=UPI003D6A6992